MYQPSMKTPEQIADGVVAEYGGPGENIDYRDALIAAIKADRAQLAAIGEVPAS